MRRTSESCSVEVKFDGDVVTVVVRGYLWRGEVEDIVALVDQLFKRGRRFFVVDMKRLKYLHYRDVPHLMDLQYRIGVDGGEVKFTGITPFLLKVLQLGGIDFSFPIYPSRREALRSITKELSFVGMR